MHMRPDIISLHSLSHVSIPVLVAAAVIAVLSGLLYMGADNDAYAQSTTTTLGPYIPAGDLINLERTDKHTFDHTISAMPADMQQWCKSTGGSADSRFVPTGGSKFGTSLAVLNDLNGDGHPEIAVGAIRTLLCDANDDDNNNQNDVPPLTNSYGRLYIMFTNGSGNLDSYKAVYGHGNATTWDLVSHTSVGPYSPGLALQPGDLFGYSIAYLGDIDNDGLIEVAVGAPLTDANGNNDAGRVYILHLNATGHFGAPPTIIDHPDFEGQRDKNFNGNRFGEGLSNIGDLDGDGIPELAVGASRVSYNTNSNNYQAGAVFVLFLHDNSTIKHVTQIDNLQTVRILSDYHTGSSGYWGLTNSAWFGHSVTGPGDINGDGIPDIVIGASQETAVPNEKYVYGVYTGLVFVAFMSTTGEVLDMEILAPVAVKNLGGTYGNNAKRPDAIPGNSINKDDWFGWSLASVGDIDGNGVPDIAVGSRDANNNNTGSTPNTRDCGSFSTPSDCKQGEVHIIMLNRDGSARHSIPIDTASLGGNMTVSGSHTFDGATYQRQADEMLAQQAQFGSAVALYNNDLKNSAKPTYTLLVGVRDYTLDHSTLGASKSGAFYSMTFEDMTPPTLAWRDYTADVYNRYGELVTIPNPFDGKTFEDGPNADAPIKNMRESVICVDPYDPNPALTITDPVDVSVPGQYNTTYSCTDKSGNMAEISANVTIVAPEPPVISGVTNNSAITHTFRDSYSAPIVTCTDNVDGNNLFVDIDQTGPINERSLPGTYNITYSCTDMAGNTAKVMTTVYVTFIEVRLANSLPSAGNPLVDADWPLMSTVYNVVVPLGNTYLDEPPTCTDDVAGTLYVYTDDNTVIDTTKTGKHKITYYCEDPSGNRVEQTRYVMVSNTTMTQDFDAPSLTLKGKHTLDDPFVLEYGEEFTEPGFSCTDDADDNPVVVKVGEDEIGDTVGIQSIQYLCYDWNDYHDSMSRFVNVTDNTPPDLILSGPPQIVIPRPTGQFAAPQIAFCTDDITGDFLLVNSDWPADTSSHFSVTYTCTDYNGQTTSSKLGITPRAPVSGGDNTVPQIAVSASDLTTNERDTVVFTADVSDDTGIAKIDWYNGPTLIHTDHINQNTNQEITRTFSTMFNPGVHLITAVVTDSSAQRNVAIGESIVMDIIELDESLLLPRVSITPGSPVSEGGSATARITVTPPSEMVIRYEISEKGSYLTGAGARPAAGIHTIETNADGNRTISAHTLDDLTDEPDGAIEFKILDGDKACNECGNYTISQPKSIAHTLVRDNDGQSNVKVNLTTTESDPTNSTRIPFVANFTAPVHGLTASDITTSSGTVANFSTVDPGLFASYIGRIGIGFGTTGNYSFNFPQGLFMDQNDRLYAVDALNYRIQIYDSDGRYVDSIPNTLANGTSVFSNPFGIVLNGTGYIHLADGINGTVIFAPDGTYVGNIPYTGDGFRSNIAINDTGHIFTTHVVPSQDGNDQVYVHSPDGTLLHSFDVRDTAEGIAVNSTGYIYVSTSRSEYTVDIYAPNYTKVGEIAGGLSVPSYVHIDENDRIYITAKAGGEVHVYDSDGKTHLYTIGSKGSKPGQLSSPAGVALNSKGHVYVMSLANYYISIYEIKESGKAHTFDVLNPAGGLLTVAVPQGAVHDISYSSNVNPGIASITVNSTGMISERPTGLRTTAVGDGQVRLTWTAPVNTGSHSIIEYVIQYRTADGQWDPDDVVVSTGRSATVAGLQNGVDHTFRVAAKTLVGQSPWSDVVTAMPRGTTQPPPPPPVNNPPELTLLGQREVTLTVGDSYDDAGATCIDDIDTNPTITKTFDDVDTSSAGRYEVTWRCEDSGNKFDTETRRVIVNAPPPPPPPVNNPPELTLLGQREVTLTVGDSYDDAGATCIDDIDTNPTITKTFDDVDTSSAGRYEVTWRCEDSGNKFDTETRTVTVNARNGGGNTDTTPPVFTSTDTLTFTELVPSTHTVVATDSSAVTYALTSHNVTGTPAPTVSAAGQLAWTPSEVQGGNPSTTYRVTITATDSHQNSAQQTIHITVSESNALPALTPTIQAQQNHISGQSITIALEATDSDVPTNTLTYTHNHTSGTITATDSRTASFAWTPGTSDVGTHYVEFTVSDGMGGTNSQVVVFMISDATIPDNDPPEFTSTDTLTFTELVPSTHTVVATDSSAVTYALTSHNVTGTPAPTVSAAGQLAWTPSEAQGGNPNTVYSVTVNATDSHQNSAQQVIHITVSESNTLPTLAPIQAQQNHISGQPITIALEATDSDVPANTLTYTDNHTSGGITQTDSRTAIFAWTPGTSDVGTYHVEFTVSDNMGGTNSQVVTFVVSDATAPDTTPPSIIIPNPGNISLVQGTTYTEPSVTCDDDHDADKPATVGGDTVDTSTPGTYTITYDCTDSANNNATQVSRIVTVLARANLVPGAPASLVATPGDRNMTLTWTTASVSDPIAYPVTHYTAWYTDDGTNWHQAGNTTDTTIVITNLTNDQLYQFRVSATNAIGDGGFSDVVTNVPTSTSTSSPPTFRPFVPSAPDAPTNLGVAIVNNTHVILSWSAPAHDGGSIITHYAAWYTDDNGTSWYSAGNTTDTTIVISNLVSDQSYQFRVFAVNSAGTSPHSNIPAPVQPVAGGLDDTNQQPAVGGDAEDTNQQPAVGGDAEDTNQQPAVDDDNTGDANQSPDNIEPPAPKICR